MTGRQWTMLALGVSAALLGAAEANALANKEPGDTISARAAEAVRQYPVVLGLGIGTLVHFATPTRGEHERLPWWQGATISALGGALLGLGWIRRDPSRPMTGRTL